MRPGNVFSDHLLPSFHDPVFITAFVSCSELTGVAPGVVFCRNSERRGVEQVYLILWLIVYTQIWKENVLALKWQPELQPSPPPNIRYKLQIRSRGHHLMNRLLWNHDPQGDDSTHFGNSWHTLLCNPLELRCNKYSFWGDNVKFYKQSQDSNFLHLYLHLNKAVFPYVLLQYQFE